MENAEGPAVDEQENISPSGECNTPIRVLFLLTTLQTVIFVDRGATRVIATNAVNGQEHEDGRNSGFRAAFEMSNFENGLLSSLLMLGLVIGCLLASGISFKYPPLYIVGAGMCLWTIGAAGCGLSAHFYMLAASRFIMGIGLSPVMGLGNVVIDGIAPQNNVTTWLSIFLLAAPVGVATGFFFGPFVARRLTWRWAFFVEAMVGIPLVTVCFLLPKFYLKRDPAAENRDTDERVFFFDSLKKLLSHPVFDVTCLGSALYTGYLICLEYWAARAIEAIFHAKSLDFAIGVILLVSSIAGTLLGGRLMDAVLGASTPMALYLSGVALAVSIAVAIPTVSAAQSCRDMLILVFLSLLHCFIPQGPLSGALLWSVPLDLRPLSRGFDLICTQVLGTIPAPAIYGFSIDLIEKRTTEANAHRWTLSGITLFPIMATILFFLGAAICHRYPDYRSPPAAEAANVSEDGSV